MKWGSLAVWWCLSETDGYNASSSYSFHNGCVVVSAIKRWMATTIKWKKVENIFCLPSRDGWPGSKSLALPAQIPSRTAPNLSAAAASRRFSLLSHFVLLKQPPLSADDTHMCVWEDKEPELLSSQGGWIGKKQTWWMWRWDVLWNWKDNFHFGSFVCRQATRDCTINGTQTNM